METKKESPKFATTKNQLIQAILGEHFRLASVAQVQVKLQGLAEQFIHSKNRPLDIPEEAVFLWIKDYEVAEKDRKNGYKGNFASIYYRGVEKSREG